MFCFLISSGVFTGPLECVWAYELDQKPTSRIVYLSKGERVDRQLRVGGGQLFNYTYYPFRVSGATLLLGCDVV